MDYDKIDRATLHNIRLELHHCPICDRDLMPVAFYSDVWGCSACKETWYLASFPRCDKPGQKEDKTNS